MSRNWMIDFDGVIADHHTALIETCNAEFGTDYTVDDIDTWNWWKQQPREYDAYVWDKFFSDETWMLENLQPYEGAITALADLATDGSIADSAMIVTARPQNHHERMAKWFAQQGVPAVTSIPIICVGSMRKSLFCQQAGLNTVIEDRPANLQQMNAYTQTLFLVDRPWNRNETITMVTHVNGLQEAIDHVAKEVVAA